MPGGVNSQTKSSIIASASTSDTLLSRTCCVSPDCRQSMQNVRRYLLDKISPKSSHRWKKWLSQTFEISVLNARTVERWCYYKQIMVLLFNAVSRVMQIEVKLIRKFQRTNETIYDFLPVHGVLYTNHSLSPECRPIDV